MKTLITIITMALSILSVNAQMTSSEKELLATLDENTPKALKEYQVPGLAIAIIKNEKVIIKKGYGYSDVDGKIVVNMSNRICNRIESREQHYRKQGVRG